MRRASTCLLVLAVAVLAGCRTRLPVEPTSVAHVAERAAPAAEDRATGLTAFLDGRASAEQSAANPLGPFLDGMKTDRLQDMVRMDLLTERRDGPFGFLRYCACVCVPGRDH